MKALKILEQNISKIREMVELVQFLLINITWLNMFSMGLNNSLKSTFTVSLNPVFKKNGLTIVKTKVNNSNIHLEFHSSLLKSNSGKQME